MTKGSQAARLTLVLMVLVPLGAVGEALAQTVAAAHFPARHREADSLLHERRFEAARALFDRLARADPLNQAY